LAALFGSGNAIVPIPPNLFLITFG
jgi:hypothetical protein